MEIDTMRTASRSGPSASCTCEKVALITGQIAPQVVKMKLRMTGLSCSASSLCSGTAAPSALTSFTSGTV